MILARMAVLETKHAFLTAIRYPMGNLFSVILLFLLFTGMFLTASAFVEINLIESGNLSSAILSYVAWTITITSLSSLASNIENEARQGTLEQLLLAEVSFVTLSIVRAFSRVFIILVMNIFVFILISAVFRNPLNFQPILIVPILMLLLSSIGLGLAIGGFSVAFKSSGGLVNLIQFLLLPVYFINIHSVSSQTLVYLLQGLPGVPAIYLLKDTFIKGHLSSGSLILAALNAFAWFFFGVVVLWLLSRKAVRAGTISHY